MNSASPKKASFFVTLKGILSLIALLIGSIWATLQLYGYYSHRIQVSESNNLLVEMKMANERPSGIMKFRRNPITKRGDRRAAPDIVEVPIRGYIKNISQLNLDFQFLYSPNFSMPPGWKFDCKCYLEDVNKTKNKRIDETYIFLNPGEEYPFQCVMIFSPNVPNDKLCFEKELEHFPDPVKSMFEFKFRYPVTKEEDQEMYKFYVTYSLYDLLTNYDIQE